jgi:hypothetical protein
MKQLFTRRLPACNDQEHSAYKQLLGSEVKSVNRSMEGLGLSLPVVNAACRQDLDVPFIT